MSASGATTTYLASNFAGELHPTRNGDLDASTVAPFSNKTYWWMCGPHGHEYEATAAKRTQGRGCPYCSGKRVLVGFNDLATCRPEIAASWDFVRNGDLTPEQVTEWSNRKVWWRCNGHSWEMKVSHRSRGLGCSICSGHVVLAGVNDLASVALDVAATLDVEQADLRADAIFVRSRKLHPWVCDLGHKWKASPKNRVVAGSGCPVCSGAQVLAGFNDLATVDTPTARQWHPARNGTLTPQQVTPGSTQQVWWMCEEGHEWRTRVAARKTRGCGKCALQGTSRVERELFDHCEAWLNDAEHLGSVRLNGKRVSLDINGTYADTPVVIEYDGSYFHADAIDRDTAKTQALLSAGFLVVRVREANNTVLIDLPLSHSRLVQVRHRFGDSVADLAAIIHDVVETRSM